MIKNQTGRATLLAEITPHATDDRAVRGRRQCRPWLITYRDRRSPRSEPECLMWLWRDYDPHKTQQTYEQSAEEQSKPVFRVRVYNR
jgi:hypothetical protein